MPTFYKSIEGRFDFGAIYEFAMSRFGDRPARFVEIGAYKGRSACYMAERIRELGLDIRFDIVETFHGGEHIGASDLWPHFSENLERAGLLSRVAAHRRLSVEAAEDFARESVDFIFMDATHTFEAVRQDIAAWRPRLRPGGLPAGHD